jgi:hypothetical protein
MSSTDDTTTEDVSYEGMTVAELREELGARDLPTSGLKDELIARLDEDDANTSAADTPDTTSKELVATSGDVERQEAPSGDPYKRVYSPYELPADPIAAQAFYDEHPGDVDTDVPLDRDAATDPAAAAIQDRVDFHASMGTPVLDPRLGQTEIPDPVLSAIAPTELPVGPPQDTTLTAIGENFTVECQIGFGVISQDEADAGLGEVGSPKWERTTFVDSTMLTTGITGGLFPSPDSFPVSVGIPPDTVYGSETFTFTESEPPELPPDGGDGDGGEE